MIVNYLMVQHRAYLTKDFAELLHMNLLACMSACERSETSPKSTLFCRACRSAY